MLDSRSLRASSHHLTPLSTPFVLHCAVAIGGIAVGALGWRQVDPSFASFFDDAMVKVGAFRFRGVGVSCRPVFYSLAYL
jgi:hypothetical protein